VIVNLSNLTRAGSETLLNGENGAYAILLDTASTQGYVGTFTQRGRVVRVAYSQGAIHRVDAISLNAGEDALNGP